MGTPFSKFAVFESASSLARSSGIWLDASFTYDRAGLRKYSEERGSLEILTKISRLPQQVSTNTSHVLRDISISLFAMSDIAKRRDRPPALEIDHVDSEFDPISLSRSTSATSSLDPYYFGASESPAPPLPLPATPARDIDRRGLVGVGELTTPRWTRTDNEEEEPDSPWTIEAVDGEDSEKEQVACSSF